MTKKKKSKGFGCSDYVPNMPIEPCKEIKSAIHVDSIHVESFTKYFAKRKTIRAAVEYFMKNPAMEWVVIEATFEEGSLQEIPLYVSTINRDKLIDLTFDFLDEANRDKLYDPHEWRKDKIEKLFEQFCNKF